MKNIGCVDRLLDRHLRAGHGDCEALVEIVDNERRSLTYKELFTAVEAMGKWLQRKIQSKSQLSVALVGENSLETVVAWLTLMRQGHLVFPVHPNQSISHYDELWNNFMPVKIFSDRFAPDCFDNLPNVDDLLLTHTYQKENINPIAPDDIKDRRPALCLRTSGSTGKSKICVHGHYAIGWFEKLVMLPVWKFHRNDRVMATTGPYFSFGLQGIYCPLLMGSTAVLVPNKRNHEQYLEIIERERVTIMLAVPTLYHILAEKASRHYDLSSLRFSISAGENLPSVVRNRWDGLFGSRMIDSIGTTETFIPFLSESPIEESGLQEIDGVEYCWQRMEDYEYDKTSLYTLRLKTPAMMLGYYDLTITPPYQSEAGLFKTNDIFINHGDSWKYFSRNSELLKVGGEWVSPQKLEDFLLNDEHIEKVCAIPIITIQGLVRLRAYVVIKPFYTDSHDMISDHLLHKVRRDLSPRGLIPESINVVQTLPSTPSGKINRNRLKSLVEESNIEVKSAAVFLRLANG